MRHIRSVLATLLLFTFLATTPNSSFACGGFFCTTVPINQAAEQIVFHQEGDQITAMVRILYSGAAEDFSWVVPVPSEPEISLGADITFTQLDGATRPQFNLNRTGDICPQHQVGPLTDVPDPASAPADSNDGGVTIEQELSVGPFDVTVVSSDNPDAMSLWLEDNSYLLTDRGRDLIAPYVNDGMKFVAMRLRSGEQTGSIQPLIMRYTSEKPMVPIRLTAIAAEDDMGVLVWLVNNARAIPENYEHVIPNYTRLNWYAGSFNAYTSYQQLITDAMNETENGQGFATDYAGGITSNIRNALTQAADIESNLASLDTVADDAQYIGNTISLSLNPTGTVALVQSLLPLPQDRTTNLYLNPQELAAIYTADELQSARATLRAEMIKRELEPVREGVALLPEGKYLTRLYTTLSAEEMSADPTFNYNAGMPEQPIIREATLDASCEADVSTWTLTLGKGTNRDQEIVIRAVDQPIPFVSAPQPVTAEPAAFTRQRTFADAQPETIQQATINPLEINADGSAIGGSNMLVATNDDSNGFLGSVTIGWLALVALILIRRLFH